MNIRNSEEKKQTVIFSPNGKTYALGQLNKPTTERSYQQL